MMMLNQLTARAGLRQTISKRKVVFSYGEPLNFVQDCTSIGSFLEIGALLNTRRFDPATGRMHTGTDVAGLNIFLEKSADSVTEVLVAIGAVSRSLAHSCDELDGGDIMSIAWLISGLSHTASRVSDGISGVQYEIKRDFCDKQEAQS
jgi:hypothetical protein